MTTKPQDSSEPTNQTAAPTEERLRAIYQAAAPQAVAWPWHAGLLAVFEAGRAASASVVQEEPVAWRVRRHDAPNYWIIFMHKPVDALQDPEREVQPLYTAAPAAPVAQPVSEPAFYVVVSGRLHEMEPTAAAFDLPDGRHALFISPAAPVAQPVREPLPDDECIRLLKFCDSSVAMVRIIERAHGITGTPSTQAPAGPSSTACDDQRRPGWSAA